MVSLLLCVQMEKKNDNVVKMRRPVQFNIGVLVFAVIFIYVMFFVIQYFTKEHVSAYMVTEGQIVQDDTYTGLAVRNETIYYTDSSGIITYYTPATDRVGAKTLVYSLDSEGVINSLIDSAVTAGEYLTDDNMEEIEEILKDFTLGWSEVNFGEVYTLKTDINTRIRDDMNANALSYLKENGDISSESFSLNYATEPGVILYYTDGYESLIADQISTDMIDKENYTPIRLESNIKLTKGSAAYKLVTDENWQIVINTTKSVYKQLKKKDTVDVTFCDDYKSAYASVSVYKSGGDYMAILSFTNSMERYADERYIDIKLTLDNVSGLKIPNSSIVEKSLYIIPKEYAALGADSDSTGFLLVGDDEEVSFITPTIYYESDDYYYLDEEELSSGSILRKPDSSDTYVVSDTDTLSGVYNINKGYAIFKQINILYQNDDYSIVESGTNYGLSQYDYIVLDSSTVEEGEIISR